MRKNRLTFIAHSGIIAAIYVVATVLGAPLSKIQLRLSEALCVLPLFTPAAVPGLFVGCVVSNILVGEGVVDVVVGSLCTLIAAALTYALRDKPKWLAPLPSVAVNAVGVGWMLNFVYGLPLFEMMGSVAFGQVLSCYGLGLPLAYLLERYRGKIFVNYELER